MPDASPASEQFPHLRLVRRSTEPAKFFGGNDPDPQVEANKNNSAGHSKRLVKALHDLDLGYKDRSAKRQAAGLPPIESGIPFAIEIPSDFDLDELVSTFKLEVVAEDRSATNGGTHRCILVAAERIEDSQLLQLVESFSQRGHRSAGVASMLEIFDDPSSSRRLDTILSEKVRSLWPFGTNDEYTFDVSFQTRGVLADLGTAPRKKPKEPKEDHQARVNAWYEENKTRLFKSWDDFTIRVEDEVQRIISAYNGETIGQWEEGELGVAKSRVLFPDSISFRIKMIGSGFTDLVLNHPRIFEVELPDEIENTNQGSLPNVLSPPPFQLLQPSEGAPLVCVIDSGIQEGHRLLAASIAESRSLCLLPNHNHDDTEDGVQNGGHGTRVAGAVIYPSNIPQSGSFEAHCWIGNARVLDAFKRLPIALYPPSMLERVVGVFSDCKIFVHSINTATPAPIRRMAAWAAKIDDLSFKHDLLFIVSVGNLPHRQPVPGKGFLDHLQGGARHPSYLLENSARIATPAQGLQALSVGSLAIDRYEDEFWKSISRAELPSCFTRTGLGLWATIKPDVVELGGDCCTQKTGSPATHVIKEQTSPHLVRSTLHGGPETSRDAVGTSFAAPKVAALAAELQRLLPNQPALLYRALIANSARWPQWAEDLELERRSKAFRFFGYGLPDRERALHNSVSRVTMITSEQISLKQGQAVVFEVPIPESLRTTGRETRLRLDVTLSYVTEPRRTRTSLHGYQAVWLDWRSSRLREPLEAFLHRMWRHQPRPTTPGNPSSIPWVLSEQNDTGQTRDIRREGTLQKDWAIISGFDLPASFAIAVRGHRGWNATDDSAEARFALAVSIEAVESSVRVYEPVRVALDALTVQTPVSVNVRN